MDGVASVLSNGNTKVQPPQRELQQSMILIQYWLFTVTQAFVFQHIHFLDVNVRFDREQDPVLLVGMDQAHALQSI